MDQRLSQQPFEIRRENTEESLDDDAYRNPDPLIESSSPRTKTRLASLSLDLDNEWSYLKTHGSNSWASFPSYLDLVVPQILEMFDALAVTSTIFVVGQDAVLQQNKEALAALGASRHEIGNHSFHHEPWLHLKSPREVEDELKNAHDAIGVATNKTPQGFRGPGFSLSRATLDSIAKLDYTYDCSTLPTFIGPLARAYYFRKSKLSGDDRETRTRLFGSIGEVFRPLKPYEWRVANGRIVEIPVTTMPALRIPFHISYVLYLARFSESMAELYFKAALKACKIGGVEPSILLHPLDLLGGDEVASLGFFPAMDMAGDHKRSLVLKYLRTLVKSYDVIAMHEHVQRAKSRGLSTRQPSLPA